MKLEAGPELDAWIAKYCNPRCEVNQNASLEDFQAWCHEFNFHPSTSIAAAWEVVEKLGGWWDITLDDSGWSVGHENERSWADTAPLAICLAAREAVEGRRP